MEERNGHAKKEEEELLFRWARYRRRVKGEHIRRKESAPQRMFSPVFEGGLH